MADQSDLNLQIAHWVGQARWFAGKDREHTISGFERIATLGAGDVPEVYVELVTVTYADDTTEVYQLPLAIYPEPVERLGHALVATGEHGYAYDATHDREAMARYLAGFRQAVPDHPVEEAPSGLEFHRLPGHDLDPESHSTLFSGEQSNSSMAFGEDSLLKLFRKVTPGQNPDIEIHRVLTEAANPHVAELFGWLTSGDLDLGMLQQFLTTATDGWALAVASARNLLVDVTLAPEDAGGDFAAEAERLGEAVRTVHEALAAGFGTGTLDTLELAAVMNARLDAAVAAASELAAYSPALRPLIDRVAGLGEAPSQRIHGDLHLGQTLRTVVGWKLVDFEGEPAKPLAERRLPDSPWRDVAGMLRSFDYAARSAGRDLPPMIDGDPQAEQRESAWVQRNRESFLSGYLGGREPTPAEEALLAAYEADKAGYEVVYEVRNRPSWVDIPMAAIIRLAETASDQQEDR